jgi:hypothetical protein
MTPLVDYLRALVGANALTQDGDLLAATDACAAKLLRAHGVLHSAAVQTELDDMRAHESCERRRERLAYYLGVQIGWRAAQRLR